MRQLNACSAKTVCQALVRASAALLAGFGVCPAFAQDATPPALDAALQSAAPGDIVELSGAGGYLYLNQSPGQLPSVAGTLIYSDDPESPTTHGILYRDQVSSGPARVYLYHVNASGTPSKLTAVVENAGFADATITFTKKSLAGPSTDFITVGKVGVQRYYENTALPPTLSLSPGAGAVLDPVLDSLSVTSGRLVSALYDLSSDQPLTVTTLLLPFSASTMSALAQQAILPGDGENRQGTFANWGKENPTPYAYSTLNQIRPLRIADGSAFYDPFLSGWDAERQTTTALAGNYGVTYRVRINVSSPNGKRLAVLLNPRAGNYAGYLKATFPDGGSFTGQRLPGSILTLGESTKAIVAAKIAPSASAQTLLLEFIPAGASNLPFELLLVPYSVPTSVSDWNAY